MTAPPTVVRLEDFPIELRFFAGRTAKQRTGVVVASERDADVAVSLRLAQSPLTFENGEHEITQIEHFAGGEQRLVELDWGLRNPENAREPIALLEIDVRYDDDDEAHTATTGVALQYANPAKLLILGSALAAVAVGAVALLRREEWVEEEEEVPDEIELAVIDIEPPKRTARTSSAKKKSSATKTSAKKTAPKKQAGGTRRGSSASQSAPRKGGRGSSAGRKSAPSRSRRTSR